MTIFHAKKHVNKNNTFMLKKNYCVDCNSTICKTCFNDHRDCKYIIQLRKGTPHENGSHNLTIENKEIMNFDKFVSLKYIQSYSFNGK